MPGTVRKLLERSLWAKFEEKDREFTPLVVTNRIMEESAAVYVDWGDTDKDASADARRGTVKAGIQNCWPNAEPQIHTSGGHAHEKGRLSIPRAVRHSTDQNLLTDKAILTIHSWPETHRHPHWTPPANDPNRPVPSGAGGALKKGQSWMCVSTKDAKEIEVWIAVLRETRLQIVTTGSNAHCADPKQTDTRVLEHMKRFILGVCTIQLLCGRHLLSRTLTDCGCLLLGCLVAWLIG